ncbi:PLD nuclease N-terminal domain-containing protein [Rhodoglobus sp.]
MDLSTIPLVVLIGVSAVLLIQIALGVAALVDLYRRPAATIATGNKWIWVVVIVISSFIGPILYFAIGRKSAQAIYQPPTDKKRSSTDIADALYGTAEKLTLR